MTLFASRRRSSGQVGGKIATKTSLNVTPHNFLCKEERRGDLKKDKKVMEIGDLINRMMQKNRKAAEKNLEFKVYSVNILSETEGLLEWVDGLYGMRTAINDMRGWGVGH